MDLYWANIIYIFKGTKCLLIKLSFSTSLAGEGIGPLYLHRKAPPVPLYFQQYLPLLQYSGPHTRIKLLLNGTKTRKQILS